MADLHGLRRWLALLLAAALWAFAQDSYAVVEFRVCNTSVGSYCTAWNTDSGAAWAEAEAAENAYWGSNPHCSGASQRSWASQPPRDPSRTSDTWVVLNCNGIGVAASANYARQQRGESSNLCDTFAGQTVYVSIPGQATPGQTTCSVVGCQATVGGTVIRAQDKITGQWVTEGDVTFPNPGVTCTYQAGTGATPDTTPNGKTCQVNGVDVYCAYSPDTNVIQSIKSTTVSGTTTTSLPDGTTTTTATQSTTTKTTTCTGSTCTTQTTSTGGTTQGGSGGSVTSGVQTETSSKADFCQNNPNDPQCATMEQKGSFAGSCSGGFTCSGDAAQCAIAQASWQQKCALVDTVSPESQLYESSKAANSTGLTSTTVAISASSFDSSNAIGVAGTCIGDVNVTVWGSAISLPFSVVCPHLAVLGNVLLALSWLTAIAIVGRGVT